MKHVFGDGSLSFHEFVTKEPLPLATVHDAVLEFMRNRDDAVLAGAQAVNAYVDESRMTQAVDILSTKAEALAEEICAFLVKEFTITTQVRIVADGNGFRIYQLRQQNRDFVHVRQANVLPPNQLVADVRVLIPEELIAQKVASCVRRHGQPKEGTDRRDLKMMLLSFPALKTEGGAVMQRLIANDADEKTIVEWLQLVASEIIVPEENEGY